MVARAPEQCAVGVDGLEAGESDEALRGTVSPSVADGPGIAWSMTSRAASSSAPGASWYRGLTSAARGEYTTPSRTTSTVVSSPSRSRTQWAAVITYRVPVIGVPEQIEAPRTRTMTSATSPSSTCGWASAAPTFDAAVAAHDSVGRRSAQQVTQSDHCGGEGRREGKRCAVVKLGAVHAADGAPSCATASEAPRKFRSNGAQEPLKPAADTYVCIAWRAARSGQCSLRSRPSRGDVRSEVMAEDRQGIDTTEALL